jgi:hypothetical protein
VLLPGSTSSAESSNARSGPAALGPSGNRAAAVARDHVAIQSVVALLNLLGAFALILAIVSLGLA